MPKTVFTWHTPLGFNEQQCLEIKKQQLLDSVNTMIERGIWEIEEKDVIVPCQCGPDTPARQITITVHTPEGA